MKSCRSRSVLGVRFVFTFGSEFRLLSSGFVVLAVLASPPGASGQRVQADAAVTRIGAYVERYYARAQSIVAEEAVSVQPLGRDLSLDGFARRLTYELRLEWNPAADPGEDPAKVTRLLLAINGRPPREGEEPGCLDPHAISPEPLAFLLPDRRHKFRFTAAGLTRLEGRAAMLIDYRSIAPEPPVATWDDECASIELPGRSRGRIWADPETAEILRFDEGLTGMVDVPVPWRQQRRGSPTHMTIERADTSVRYRRVSFTDPDETLLLPAAVETVTVIRNSGSPRTRITQTFSKYRRFVTGTRIVQ
jgi:hypothetical protein